MGLLFNRVKMSVATAPGTGTISLGSAVAGYTDFATAGVPNSAVVSYVIEDGTSWEYGQGTYTSSGLTLARTTIQGSSAGGTTAISASSGATVFISPLATDLVSATSFAASGYVKFPSGLIIQWATLSMSGGSSTWTFPTAFPTACVNVNCIPIYSGLQVTGQVTNSPSKTSVAVAATSSSGGATCPVFVFAIGY